MKQAADFMPTRTPTGENCPDCGRALYTCTIPAVGCFSVPQACACVLAQEETQRKQQLERGRALVRQRLREISGMRKRQQTHTFAGFDAKTSAERRAKKPALDAAAAFAAQYLAGQASGVLYLHGHVGCGKTHLACAIANRAIDRIAVRDEAAEYAGKYGEARFLTRKPVRFTTAAEMLAEIRRSFRNAAQTDILAECKRARLLILDDLGAEKPSDWTRECLFELFDHRNEEGLPTVITSNLSPDSLREQLGERITDRIRDRAAAVRVPGGSERG